MVGAGHKHHSKGYGFLAHICEMSRVRLVTLMPPPGASLKKGLEQGESKSRGPGRRPESKKHLGRLAWGRVKGTEGGLEHLCRDGPGLVSVKLLVHVMLPDWY